MKKLLLILVVAILVLTLPAGVVAAKVEEKTEANRIEFNLDVGTYKIGDAEPVSASAVLTGNLREKDGKLYLSPLNGTITIDGEEHNIVVKAEKQSKPLRHIDNGAYDVYLLPDVVVNVEGWKAISGDLEWGTKIIKQETYSELEFWGTVDGEWVDCDLSGPLPTSD